MLQPILVTPPATTPVSLAEAKAHCRADTFTTDDTYLTGLIGAAVGHLDGRSGILGRCIIEQTWAYRFDDWPADYVLRTDMADVSEAVVTYVDADGATQTVDSALYDVEHGALGAFIWFKKAFTSPALNDDKLGPITVTVTAGFPDGAPGLEAVKHAMKLMIAHWYENREAIVVGVGVDTRELPMAVNALIQPYRRVGL